MKREIIPVVFATDENYVVPTYVAAYSMLKKANHNYFYDIYIMIPDNMTEYAKLILLAIEKKFKNCKINFLNMKNAFQEIEMQISYITAATYYRLLLPELLPQYEKCLYLDSDIVVVDNIVTMFECQEPDVYLSGVIAGNPALSSLKGEARTKHSERLEIDNIDRYVNAGVLVFNLNLMRKDCLVRRFMEKVPLKFPYQDQDILNSICYGKIQYVDRRYNVCPLNRLKTNNGLKMTEREIDTIKLAYAKPAIVHYAQPQKPWLSRRFPMAFYWWKYYDDIDSQFREKYLDDFIRKNKKNAIKVRIKHSKIVMSTWQILKKITNKR